MTSTVNLQELVVERATPSRRRRIPWISRYLLPGLIGGGFVAVAAWSMRDSLQTAIPVTVVPVLVTTSQKIAGDTPLFRAAGWIEPRPTPTYVTALGEGVIERLLVVEGQEVKIGQPVALLVKRDSEIAVQQAQADLALKQANLGSVMAQLNAAKTYWKEPIERQAALSEAEATLAKVKTELSRLPALIASAQAKLEQFRKEVESKSKSGEAIAKISLERSKSEVAVALSLIEELQSQQTALKNEVTALSRRRDILHRQLELKVEEERELKDAEALYSAGEAQVRQAEAALSAARLKLERMTVVAPIDGKVLALIAKPGSRLMGIDRAALTDASTVISMYDPHQLQVRADVRLENVPKVQLGQTVRIETPAAEKPLTGRVLAMTSLTDIQKNTLQVKIELENPPAVLKPDMLVEATFLSMPMASAESAPTQGLRLMIPLVLVDGSTTPPQVWVADLSSRIARRKTIQLGNPLPDDMIEVVQGLTVGDRLIATGREFLKPDSRISVTGETTASSHSMNSNHDHPPNSPKRLY